MFLRHLAQHAFDWVAYLAGGVVGTAALITGVDIVLRQTIGSPIRGLVDLTQLAMMYAVFLAIAYGFARGSHVAVTVLTEGLSVRVNAILSALWWLVSTGLLAMLAYAAFGQAALIASYGDVSQNIRIPMILYWLPVVAGLVLAALGSLWIAFEPLMRARTDTRGAKP